MELKRHKTESTVDNRSSRGYFFELIRFVDVTEHVLDQRVQYVQTVYLVAPRYRQIETNQRHDVRLGYPQWRVQARDEVRDLIESYELRGVRIVPEDKRNRTPFTKYLPPTFLPGRPILTLTIGCKTFPGHPRRCRSLLLDGLD